MDFLIVTETESVTQEVEALAREVSREEPMIIEGEYLLENGHIPPADVIVMEFAVWQRYYSMYSYFGVREEFDDRAMVVVGRKKSQALKGRLGVKDIFLSLPASADIFEKAVQEARENTAMIRQAAEMDL